MQQRPDLFGQEQAEFRFKLKYGQQLLRHMNYQTKLEMKRLWRVMGGMSYNYFYVTPALIYCSRFWTTTWSTTRSTDPGGSDSGPGTTPPAS